MTVDDAGTITAVGTRASLRAQASGLPETRAEGVLLPGLVNAHTHLELAHLAGAVPGGEGVIAWTRALAARLRDATHIDGAAAVLLGIAANQSIKTGLPVNCDDLIKLPSA